jgi:hypothetical protein
MSQASAQDNDDHEYKKFERQSASCESRIVLDSRDPTSTTPRGQGRLCTAGLGLVRDPLALRPQIPTDEFSAVCQGEFSH